MKYNETPKRPQARWPPLVDSEPGEYLTVTRHVQEGKTEKEAKEYESLV